MHARTRDLTQREKMVARFMRAQVIYASRMCSLHENITCTRSRQKLVVAFVPILVISSCATHGKQLLFYHKMVVVWGINRRGHFILNLRQIISTNNS